MVGFCCPVCGAALRATEKACICPNGHNFDKAKAAGISDTQLYKQAGNSVSVPVAKAIGVELRRIELLENVEQAWERKVEE